MLEKELQEIIALTTQELEEHREKVLELEDEVGRASSSHSWTGLAIPVQLWCRERVLQGQNLSCGLHPHCASVCRLTTCLGPSHQPPLLRGSSHALSSTPPEWLSER